MSSPGAGGTVVAALHCYSEVTSSKRRHHQKSKNMGISGTKKGHVCPSKYFFLKKKEMSHTLCVI